MTDYSDLVERLQDLHKQATTEKSHFYVAKCCRDSISAIEALVEEVDRLNSVAQAETDMRVGTFDTITQLQNQLDAETKLHLENESRHMALAMGWKNRIERLEGALQRIADKSAWDTVMELKNMARAALEAKL